uniref:Acyclotide phyb-K n=1 Tax=Petunia hybrida TaxID=4102 RepID=CYCK_PETHY|nr:RecName: Full=Acyclotide phyb-K; Flags: Precursor [Petunia x hybrida]
MARVNSLKCALCFIVLILFVQLNCIPETRVMAVELSRVFLQTSSTDCGEPCVYIPCTITALLGCSCLNKVCVRP